MFLMTFNLHRTLYNQINSHNAVTQFLLIFMNEVGLELLFFQK